MNATGKWLDERKAPGRKVKQIDNRGSSFYVGLYWAQERAQHDSSFKALADALAAKEEQIVKELIDVQGPPVDIGGYYKPDVEKVDKAMRPCQLLNEIFEKN
jgi:isocitrate dehydrogenase